jgi:ATP-dependent 26S proteasome regulatory subunit
MNINKDIDIKELASRVDSATGADVKAICTEAGMFAIREKRGTVTFNDFENAIAKVLVNVDGNTEEAGVMYT